MDLTHTKVSSSLLFMLLLNVQFIDIYFFLHILLKIKTFLYVCIKCITHFKICLQDYQRVHSHISNAIILILNI